MPRRGSAFCALRRARRCCALMGWTRRGRDPEPAQVRDRGGAAHLQLGLRGRRRRDVRARPAPRLPRQAHALPLAVRRASCAGWAASPWTAASPHGVVGESIARLRARGAARARDRARGHAQPRGAVQDRDSCTSRAARACRSCWPRSTTASKVRALRARRSSRARTSRPIARRIEAHFARPNSVRGTNAYRARREHSPSS